MSLVVSITKTLKRGSKKGLTAEQIAWRTGAPINSIRSTLWQLKKDGSVTVIGTVQDGSYGRPANLYTL